jgi:hypothetical protein
MHRLIQWIWTCHEGSPWHTTTYLISYLTLATESYGWRIRRPMFLKVWSANYGIHPLGSEATSMCACSGRYHQSSYVWSKKGRLRQIAKETKTPSMASDIYDYTPERPDSDNRGSVVPYRDKERISFTVFLRLDSKSAFDHSSGTESPHKDCSTASPGGPPAIASPRLLPFLGKAGRARGPLNVVADFTISMGGLVLAWSL